MNQSSMIISLVFDRPFLCVIIFLKFILMIIKEIIGNTFFHDSKLPKDIKMYQLQCEAVVDSIVSN